MTPDFPCFSIARFVLEAESAFAIASGLSDGAFDALVVRDANNLPAVPGTSLAGVLRNLYLQQYNEEATNQLFGFITPYATQSGNPSRLHVSWGCVHDSYDQPVEGIHDKVLDDALLERLALDHPLHRERVKINNKGVAEDQKKFDMTVIPAGCRFSFEISLWSQVTDAPEWKQLLALLNNPALRMGGSVRSGLGQFRLERLHQASFDLRKVEDYQAFACLPVGIGQVDGLQAQLSSPQSAVNHGLRVTLNLQAEDFWRVGQGTESLDAKSANGRTPNALPFTEPRIGWESGKGQITPRHVVVPGSGVKGALWHRVTFHYQRKLLGMSEGEKLALPALSGVAALFGKEGDTVNGESQGQAGMIFFSDLYLEQRQVKVAQMAHTSIDRFTGGVRDHVLYLEELLWKQPLTLTLTFDQRRLDDVDQPTREALALALDDLACGRLALGAASSKGHGYFRVNDKQQDIVWSDSGNWIKGQNA